MHHSKCFRSDGDWFCSGACTHDRDEAAAEARAELLRLRKERESLLAKVKGLENECTDLFTEVDSLRKVLRWYANEENYFETVGRDSPGELYCAGTVEEAVIPDRGERARDALKQFAKR